VLQKVRKLHEYVDIKIKDPRLWWPNGIGEQNVYSFVVRLLKSGAQNTVDSKKVLYGIRTTKLDRTDNKFTITVNGHEVYCKGANYLPPDMFYPRLTNPSYKPGYTHASLINDAVESHFNMLRVWGGGQY
jgi:beta-mannosidase